MLIRYPPQGKSIIKDSSKCKKSEKKYAYLQKPWHYEELQKEITLKAFAPSSKVFIISICLEDRNVFARFDEIPSMTL